MRTIDADALKKDIEENSIVLEGVKAIEVDCAKALIDNAPTVMNGKDYDLYLEGYKQGKKGLDRPKGEWIELPKAFDSRELPCKCSICEHILSFINFYPKSNFCPNCGADMRGKANE